LNSQELSITYPIWVKIWLKKCLKLTQKKESVGRNFSNMKLIGISKRKWKKSYHSHLLWMEVLAKMYANFIWTKIWSSFIQASLEESRKLLSMLLIWFVKAVRKINSRGLFIIDRLRNVMKNWRELNWTITIS
jgi:ribosomal protein L28